MAERRLAGRVLHRGRPQAGCQVLAVDEQAREVLADAETGADGGWALALREAPADVLVFARCRGEALGVVAVTAPAGDGPLELEITGVAPTHELTVRVQGDGMPDWVRPQVRLTPLRVGSLEQGLLRWVHAPVRQLSSSALARIYPEGRELRRFVQEGTWWLTAEFFEEASVRAPDMPPPVSWAAVAAVTDGGRQLRALKSGFEFEVAGALTVTITLAQSDPPPAGEG